MRARAVFLGLALAASACVAPVQEVAVTQPLPQTAITCEGATPPPELAEFLTTAAINRAQCDEIEGADFVLATFEVAGDEAIPTWERLAILAEGSGVWPVLLGDPTTAERSLSSLELNLTELDLSPTQVLADASAIEYESWLGERTDYILGDIGGDYPTDGTEYDSQGSDFIYFTPIDTLTAQFRESIVIAIVPAAESWETAAYLLWGCWNDNPCPEEHVTVLREWNERFGADVVAMAGDVLELRVSRPPEDWDEALQLAREQYVYDYDIVDQGTESIEVLASFLLDAPGWYFWWD